MVCSNAHYNTLNDVIGIVKLIYKFAKSARGVPWVGRELRSKTRTCTAQQHINTPGKFRLFYFSI